ncbi:MAG TPA: hypothetical protein VHX11_04585 [Acidobacteriaceae bacterium]|nr:hypothetical protein [Acidobacteriaceae bacterium]
MTRWSTLALLSLATLCAPAFGANQAGPGTVNYIEGSASLAGKPLDSKSVGNADLARNQVLSTAEGKAEILMTPGVYLRLDDNSSIKMLSPNLTFTQFDLERGRATVEVDEIYPQNDLQIVTAGVPTEMLKPGLYEFNAANGTAEVFQGKAAARQDDGKWVVIKGGRELALNAADGAKPHKFKADAAKDELYNWSSLRSQYLSDASAELSQQYPVGYASGWYWDPYFFDYTFMGPYPFFSPFGWGFYPFGYAGPIFSGGHYGRGFIGHGYVGRGYAGRGYAGSGFHGGVAGGGFHGGGGGGGFHGGGGGGFHGGGGGGFHGGGGGGFHGGGGGGGRR